MPSSYTSSLRLTLPVQGELSGSWGNTVNTGITQLVDTAVAGTASITMTAANYTLSNNNGTTDEARAMFLVLGGTPGGSYQVICPTVSKLYFVTNNTGFAQTVKTSGGSGISVPTGTSMTLRCDGTNVVEALNASTSFTLSGALTVGGTTTLAANPTLSAGTANGVLYLNGSKVATSGSALTFDGSSLGVGVAVPGQVIDGSAANPRLRLTATSTGYAASQFVNSSGASYFGRDNSAGGFFGIANGTAIYSSTSDPIGFYLSGSEQMRLTSTGLGIGTSSPGQLLDISKSQNAQTAARVANSNAGASAEATFIASNGTYLGSFGIAGASKSAFGALLASDAYVFSDANVANTGIALVANGTNGVIKFASGGSTERMRLDSSGNLGLGVTPSAWNADYKAIQVGANGSIAGRVGTSNSFDVSTNAYRDNVTGDWRYIASSGVSRYSLDGSTSAHIWFTAPSGTAGNTISFTQAMTLDASGRLLVGRTTNFAGEALQIDANGVGSTVYSALIGNSSTSTAAYNTMRFTQGASGSATGYLGTGGSTVANAAFQNTFVVGTQTSHALVFNTNDTERARITSGGYFKASNNGTYAGSTATYHEFSQSADDSCLVLAPTNASFTSAGLFIAASRAANAAYYMIRARANAVDQFYVTGAGVIYAQNTTIQSLSDARLKENVRNAVDGLNVVNALRPVRYDWKPGYGNDRKDQLGFIAQEVEAVFPEAVSEWATQEGEDAYKTVGPGALIPVLVKAIQEQQALITALTARVQALEAQP